MKIKRMPVAVGLMVFGIVWLVISAANSWVVPGTVSAIAVFAGFVWFCLIWDKVCIYLIKAKYYDSRMRRKESDQKEKDAYRDLHDRAVDNKLKALEKRSSQSVIGKLRRGDTIYEIRKDA